MTLLFLRLLRWHLCSNAPSCPLAWERATLRLRALRWVLSKPFFHGFFYFVATFWSQEKCHIKTAFSNLFSFSVTWCNNLDTQRPSTLIITVFKQVCTGHLQRRVSCVLETSLGENVCFSLHAHASPNPTEAESGDNRLCATNTSRALWPWLKAVLITSTLGEQSHNDKHGLYPQVSGVCVCVTWPAISLQLTLLKRLKAGSRSRRSIQCSPVC